MLGGNHLDKGVDCLAFVVEEDWSYFYLEIVVTVVVFWVVFAELLGVDMDKLGRLGPTHQILEFGVGVLVKIVLDLHVYELHLG